MGSFYNPRSTRERRRSLRTNATKAERIFWLGIRDGQAGARFRRQSGIDDFILDFYSPEVRLGIELDGDHHNTPQELEHNAWRQSIIESYDIKVLRFRDEEILNGYDAAVDLVRSEVASRKRWPRRPGS